MARTDQTSRNVLRSATLSVEGLAGRALAELATASCRTEIASRSPGAGALCDALFDGDDSAYHDLVLKLIAEGLTSDELLDDVIPGAARRLGEEWLSDGRSFADVTIGASRLQQTVRNLGARYERDGSSVPVGHRALLVLPESEQHSLGSFIIANQLRRHGVWVQMVLDCKIEKLGAALENQHFSMIGISIGTDQSLDLAPSVVKVIRSVDRKVPIILGGSSLLDISENSVAKIGADFAAANAREALDFCEISVSRGAALSHRTIDA